MSDFLGHLAARIVDPERAVRPRLASRFEPVSPAAPALPDNGGLQGPSLVEVRAEEPAIAPPPARSLRPATAAPAAPEATAEEAEREPAPAPSRRRRARRRSGAEDAPALSAPLPRPRQEPLQAQVRPAPSRPRMGPTPSSEPDGAPAVREPADSPSSRGRRLSARDGPEPADSPAPRPPPTFAAPPSGTTAALLAPPARAVLAPRAKQPPEPTIQVTIGRIEVRATPPPAPSTRPPTTAPAAVSLDEYLRQRSKGAVG